MFDHKTLAEKHLKRWEEINLLDKRWEKNAKGKKFWYLDGPPYANAPPHMGHALTRALREAIIKYHLLKGDRVRLKPGFDTHGLPVEVEVQKKLGLTTSKEIEEIGVEKFNEECRRNATEQLSIWKEFYRDYGSSSMWDLDNPYFTFNPDYVYATWRFIKKAHEKGLLYKGKKTVPWCPKCSTALAAHEVTEGYKEIEDTSVYLRFKLKGREKEYLLVWTTTPWTLPGDVAVAVHPEFTYAKVKIGEDYYWMLKDLVETLTQKLGAENYEIVEEKQGKEMEGWEYEPFMLPEVPLQEEIPFKIILADYVTTEEGTGLVHTAPGYGPEDYESGLKYGLPVVCTVDENGIMTQDAGKYAGMPVFEANKRIAEDLKAKGVILKEEKIVHRYPHCWRCKSKLIYRASEQWFFKVGPLIDKMLEENEKIKWVPDWVGNKRFKEWIMNARDWCISRQRYWGIPLPIWQCKNGHIKVIGSKKEFLEQARVPEDFDPHKPYIDEVKLKCDECGEEMTRVPDVADVWFDSGAAPWASFFGDDEEFAKWFPADFIQEGLDQTRGWFYTLLVESTLLYDQTPFLSCLVNGLVLDEKGEKMSKSKGNVTDPRDLVKEHGADVVRLYLLINNAPWENFCFDKENMKKVAGDVLNTYWNTFLFAKKYFQLHDYNGEKPMQFEPEDRWILSRANRMLQVMERAYDEELNTNKAARAWVDFVVNDLSKTYIKLVRNRIKEGKNREAVYYCLKEAIEKASIAGCTIAPFITEEVYLGISGKEESVHLEDWPEADEELIDEKLEQRMEKAKQIIEAGLSLRNEVKIKVRQPLPKVSVETEDPVVMDAVKELGHLIKDQLNVKKVLLEPVQEDLVSREEQSFKIGLDTTITDELRREGYTREVIRAIQQARKELGLVEADKVIVQIIGGDQLRSDLLVQEIKDATNTVELDISQEKTVEGKEKKARLGEEKVTVIVKKA